MSFKAALLIFGLGAVAGIGFTCFGTNQQIAHLKKDSADAALIGRHADSSATAAHDSTAKALAKLDQIEHAAEAGAATADKRVKVFHDALHAMVDSNAAAKAALDSLEAAHAVQVAQLEQAKAAADSKVLILGVENASLLRTVHDLNGQVQDLNSQIQKLNEHRLPGWARTTFELARTGLAVWKGVELVTGR